MNTKTTEHVEPTIPLFLTALHKKIKSLNVSEIGSSSIDQSYADTCTKVRDLMNDRFGICQQAESLNESWKSLGDNSAVFYFGGFSRNDEGETVRISAGEYTEKLLKIIHELPEKNQMKLDELCKQFFSYYGLETHTALRKNSKCRSLNLTKNQKRVLHTRFSFL